MSKTPVILEAVRRWDLSCDAIEDRTEWVGAELCVVEGKGRPQVLVLTDSNAFDVGRSEGQALCIPEDPKVSRAHCRLHHRSGAYWIEDLESRWGTFHNGHEVTTRIRLRHHDRIHIGDTVLQFRDPVGEQGASGSHPRSVRDLPAPEGATTGTPVRNGSEPKAQRLFALLLVVAILYFATVLLGS